MASLAYYPNGLGLGFAVTVVMLIFSLAFFPYSTSGSAFFRGDEGVKQRKMVLGSRPPPCDNKCLSCKPCMAALVTPPHHKTASTPKGDESYYLLSWKCKCGDKYFQP
ncbi:EPIDERMAL PATTERNING FACTOR-like protein 8 isoform X2 [Hevea brasiliensis]|uniref:EPIDERMAL PATTERNING FACTOR-like protein 8 isoform X2 n=1 Tax=Hevea brasiliensis TaxID=3981 RepID=UPI0025F3D6CF|nr:EPIDERMAL PATTERNING FACTOR-like protein 8 isoform X2 [Hevea brasiliensis]